MDHSPPWRFFPTAKISARTIIIGQRPNMASVIGNQFRLFFAFTRSSSPGVLVKA